MRQIVLAFMFTGAAVAALMTGCSGGSNTPAQTPDDSIGSVPSTDKTIRGPITGFGSVIVGGVRFDTTNADITVDGLASGEDQLKSGQIVTVRGSVDASGKTGTADNIDFEAEIRGAIEQIDLDNNLIVAVGQVVLITDTTSFGDDIEPASIEGLQVGDLINVSGFIDTSGNTVALHIGKHADNDRIKVKGTVSELDTTNMRFQIEALVVDYSAATLEDFPDGMILNGDFVEVKCAGSAELCYDADGVLLATEVELDDEDLADDGDEVEIEGLITRFESITDFDVAEYPVTTTDQTEFKGGSAADLALDVRIEVEGVIDDSGVLVADEVKIKRKERIRVTAQVDAVDPVTGTITMLGISIQINDETRFKDKSDAKLRMFALADIAPGDPLEIRAYQTPPGMGPVIATRLERQKPDDGDAVELQGYVDSFDADTGDLSVQGVEIETDADTEFSDDIFVRVMVGSLVRVRGDRIGDQTVLARKVKLKHDDDDQDGEFELEGFVTRFESAEDFDVAGNTVTTNAATEFRNGSVDDLAMGVRVEVKGLPDSDGIIVARRVKFEDPDGDDDMVEIEGLISNFASPIEFHVAGHPVTTTLNTVYEDGTVDDLANGVPIEVEGSLDDMGILVAAEIEFDDVDDIRIEGVVQEVNADAGTFTVLGISVAFDSDTQMDQASDLAVGDFVSVRAMQRPPGEGPVMASSVNRPRVDPPGRIKLRAYVDTVAIDEGSLSMLGVSVLSTAATVFVGGSDMPLSVEIFFSEVSSGSLVEVTGEADNTNVVTAIKMELERR